MALPEPPGGVLGSDERRNYILNSISREAWETQSGAQILNTLSAAGLGIREGDFYALRREVLGLQRYEEQLARLKDETLVPSAWMAERPALHLSMEAQYRYRLTVVDEETGEETVLSRAMATSKHYTRQEAEDQMRGLMAGILSEYGLQLTDTRIYEVWTRSEPKLTR